jgi:hypothetical protein
MGMKKCPFCAEKIQSEAIKCKHCGEMLVERNSDTFESPLKNLYPEKKKKSRLKLFLILLILFIFFVMLMPSQEQIEKHIDEQRTGRTETPQAAKQTITGRGGVGSVPVEETESKLQTDNKPQKSTISTESKPQIEEKALTPLEKLEKEILKVLGSSNRKMPRLYKISEENRNVQIVFIINDNLTNNMIKFGAREDIEKILKKVQSSGYDYSEVTVAGTFLLTDKFGNSEESPIAIVKFKRETINKINWESFISDNIFDIADSVWLHPTFK